MESESADHPLTNRWPWLAGQGLPLQRPSWDLSALPRSLAIDDTSPIRLASHIALLLVTVLVLSLTRVQWKDWDIPWQLPAPVPQSAQLTAPLFGTQPRVVQAAEGGSLVRAAVPITKVPERPREGITHYVVVPGDTVTGIAEKFGISADTVKWANELDLNPDMLRVGQELIILPVSGVYHVVAQGDTLSQIAKQYKVSPEVIANYPANGLKDINQPLAVGQVLIVPGGEKPWVAPYVSAYSGPVAQGSQKGTGRFGWPAAGRLTSRFGQIVRGRAHSGIDIGAPPGAPVSASDSGTVVFAGWDRTGYGNLVIINHGNGYITYYAHLSKILVKRGATVAQGQRVGTIGCTGTCTGPHLHFEVRQNNVPRNPLGFLP